MRATAFTLAQELTRTATNTEFGDLRDDMVTEIIHRRVHEAPDTSAEVVEGALRMLCVTVAVLADEIAETGRLRNILDELMSRPNFDELLDLVHALETAPATPVVVVEAAGITVRHKAPLTRAEARHVAMRLLEAATATERVLRRPAGVDEAHRDREGGV
ncbi:hypothetical protein ACI3KS_01835 [Microbacterium sp. ZW T5_45]|uniref:hypothetical protein n=1 Tax=Microbacterium sp. ZW T5_45 TaxID=3378080 RepID=UPI0038529C89